MNEIDGSPVYFFPELNLYQSAVAVVVTSFIPNRAAICWPYIATVPVLYLENLQKLKQAGQAESTRFFSCFFSFVIFFCPAVNAATITELQKNHN